MTKHRFIFLICVVMMTACGQSITPTLTETSPETLPASTSTLPVTFGPFLTPTPGGVPLLPPEIATAQAADSDNAESAAASETPTPTPIPVLEHYNFEVDLPYLQDGGALPPEALGRIGIGTIGYVSPLGGDTTLLIGTSTGIYTYQRNTFERIWRRYLAELPWGVIASPDGARIISHFGWDAAPIMYNTEDGNRVTTLDGWREAVWSPDSTKVAVEERPPLNLDFEEESAFTARINLYNGLNGEYLRSLEVELSGFFGGVFSDITWSPDSARVAACAARSVYIWDALNGELQHTIPANTTPGGLYNRLCGIGFSPDSQYLFLSDTSKRYILDLDTGDIILDEEGEFNNIGWSGESILYTDSNGLSILDLNTRETIDSPGDIVIEEIALSSSGDRLAVVNEGGDIIVMGLPAFEILYEIPLYVDYVYWSPDDKWVIGYAAHNGAYILIDAASGERHFSPLVSSNGIQFLDSDTLLVADEMDVFLVDMLTGEVISGVHYGIDVAKMGWSPDGQLLLLDSEKTLWAWAEDTGEVIKLEDDPPSDILETVEIVSGGRQTEFDSTSPNGQFHVTISGNVGYGDGPFGGDSFFWISEFMLTHFDGETEKEIGTSMVHHTGISTLSWSPDSSMLALGEGGIEAVSSGCEIVILDTQTGNELFRFEGHLGGIDKLIFSADGSRLASASSDGTVIIWNTAR